jgi:hypothetical protein
MKYKAKETEWGKKKQGQIRGDSQHHLPHKLFHNWRFPHFGVALFAFVVCRFDSELWIWF